MASENPDTGEAGCASIYKHCIDGSTSKELLDKRVACPYLQGLEVKIIA